MEGKKNTARSVSMRMILYAKKKINDEGDDANVKNNRILISVNVVGSSGPLRFLVNENDKVSSVIHILLKLYACGGRLPALGSNFKSFILYASDAGLALSSSDEIGSCGGRNFMLCTAKNNQIPEARSQMITRQHSRRWKSCILCIAQ